MQITSLFLIIISATAAVSQTLIKVGPNDDSPDMTYYDTVDLTGVTLYGKAKYRNQLSSQLFHKKYEKFCLELPVRIQNAVSSYRVTNGCCSFYDDKNCESHLFTADTRQHWRLGKKHDKQIKSLRCNYAGCKESGSPKPAHKSKTYGK
ncbi:hypothetical protein FPQ18DRAFT_302100 [Pyronema domesticum]|uniref:Uncharacterized protein n=1 Tax=Pyronema omphalodes (strain CBS 100304) TaxID=1076935 RepID=U4L041_PYROM|nr:hypothetical protein FPQ18DRAFT_302100 [Pyronema domesticum]CCX07884.1 Similar to hypothetical protein [Podospora anserina S mat+]; acc. no. XP_001903708 [Pyronema omphalodes CBS 100304]